MNPAPVSVAVQCFGPALALAVARVPADPSAHAGLASTWLAGGEHTRCARFQVDHARADFLAGRIAAKTAACALVPPRTRAPGTWEIIAGEHQQPCLDHVLPGFAVTIAHTGSVGLAAVHAAGERWGIDLESIERDADAVIATQVTPAEAAWARAGGDAATVRERWLVLWTAREAQGKSHGTGLLEPARLRATENWIPTPSGWRAQLAGDPAAVVHAVVAGGFVATIVLPSEFAAGPVAAWLATVLAS